MALKKSSWLQQFEGIEVLDPHSNDGLFVFINQGFTSWHKVKQPYTRLTFCPFYINKDGKRVWKYRKVKTKDKTLFQYDLISVDLSVAELLAEAIYKMAGKDVKPAKPTGDDRMIEKYLKL